MTFLKSIWNNLKRRYIAIPLFIVAFVTISASADKYFEISKNIEIFTTLFKELNTYYVDDIDPNKLMETGIESMLSTLDPFTNYITGADIDEYQLITTGKYDGVGARIGNMDGNIVITDPYEGYPAQKAGLMAGDIIVEIDGKSAIGYSTDRVSELLKGQPGTSVKLRIKKFMTGEITDVTIQRDEIKINNVPYYGMLNDNIGYIKLDNFAEKAGQEVADALKALKVQNPGIKGIVFDLRGNGGGLLNEAINVSNVFVDKGLQIVSTKGKIADSNHEYLTVNKAIDTDIPLVVLIDEGTASASEIVSGSMQDLDRGIVIGQNSYGKGLVQITRPIAYKSRLKVTTSKYYIPSGRCIQRIDYSHRGDDGIAKALPDSLRREFNTKGGRVVKDGAGIEPDIKTELPEIQNVTRALYEDNYFFYYANIYRKDNPTLVGGAQYRMTDEEYDKFLAYLKDKEIEYTTESEEQLKKLKKTAEKEEYLAAIQGSITDLEAKIMHDKEKDLIKQKHEIKKVLEMEIVSRYYYEKGRIASSLKDDIDILKAIETINSKDQYLKLLGKK